MWTESALSKHSIGQGRRFAVFLIFLILYLNTKSITKTAIVLRSVPFSLVGAIWLMYVLGYNWSIAAWVGIVAFAGLDPRPGS